MRRCASKVHLIMRLMMSVAYIYTTAVAGGCLMSVSDLLSQGGGEK